ncbi:hypothetical protein ACU61A_28975 [Pseudonocardia sichuanensis]
MRGWYPLGGPPSREPGRPPVAAAHLPPDLVVVSGEAPLRVECEATVEEPFPVEIDLDALR